MMLYSPFINQYEICVLRCLEPETALLTGSWSWLSWDVVMRYPVCSDPREAELPENADRTIRGGGVGGWQALITSDDLKIVASRMKSLAAVF